MTPSQTWSTEEHPRWRDSRWRDQADYRPRSDWVLVCEDTGVPVTPNGQCPIHHGDACLYASTTLVVALRELEEERLQTLGKLRRAFDALADASRELADASEAFDEDGSQVAASATHQAHKRAYAVLADLRPDQGNAKQPGDQLNDEG